MTAVTRTGMLSRVIVSCGGTVSVTVRRLTRTIRSIVGVSRIRTGSALIHQPAEPEHHRALVLAQHPDRRPGRGHRDHH